MPCFSLTTPQTFRQHNDNIYYKVIEVNFSASSGKLNPLPVFITSTLHSAFPGC